MWHIGPLTFPNPCLSFQTLLHFLPNCCRAVPTILSNSIAASSAPLTGVLEISRSLKMRRSSAESLRLSVWSQSRTQPVSETSTFQPDFRAITEKQANRVVVSLYGAKKYTVYENNSSTSWWTVLFWVGCTSTKHHSPCDAMQRLGYLRGFLTCQLSSLRRSRSERK